jgi:hypothetical protein
MPQTRRSVQSSRFPTFIFPFLRATVINPRMKAILATLFLTIIGCTFVGCESDMPPNSSIETPLRRGLSGQGKLVPVDNANDPLIEETSGPAAN